MPPAGKRLKEFKLNGSRGEHNDTSIKNGLDRIWPTTEQKVRESNLGI